MNRKLIVRMLGALLLIEAAAMLPALIISFLYRDGDSRALGLTILLIAPLGSAFVFDDNSNAIKMETIEK